LPQQLNTPLLVDLAKQDNSLITVRMLPDFDHSYFFIATCIAEHLLFHCDAMSEN